MRVSSCAVCLLALTLAVGAEVSAHRQDECLQAARLAIDPDRVHVELDLTPGIAFAESILADIDRDRDGSLSSEEQRAYASLVVSALELEVDGTRLRAQLDASSFPDADAVRRGEGIIRLRSAAMLPRLSTGAHQIFFRNRHHPDRSVYLANALVSESARVAVTAQRRDRDQSELTIDFTTQSDAAISTPAWLGTIVGAAGLAALLRRRSRGRVIADM